VCCDVAGLGYCSGSPDWSMCSEAESVLLDFFLEVIFAVDFSSSGFQAYRASIPVEHLMMSPFDVVEVSAM